MQLNFIHPHYNHWSTLRARAFTYEGLFQVAYIVCSFVLKVGLEV